MNYIVRKWLIEKRGNKSQQEVAAACGISQQAYSAIEIGTRRPSPELSKAIAKELDFDWTKFYEDIEPVRDVV